MPAINNPDRHPSGITMSPDSNHPRITHAPYFMAVKRDGRWETSGQAAAECGHRLPSANHDVDDGIFASWRWDGVHLVVHNDRYGLHPLFWFQPPDGGIAISTSPIRLLELGASPALNTEALAVFFRLGSFAGDDTPFSAIKAVPPHAVFTWENGKLACHGRYPPTPKATQASRDDAIDAYIALFARSMEKRAPEPGNFAVPVSGGRDCRHILLELHRTGRPPALCVSARDNPPYPNQDPEIARLLCRELGFRHVVIDQQLSLLAAQLRKNRETGFCASAHGWYIALADFLNGRFEGVYDGIAGDVWSQSVFLDPHLASAFRERDPRTVAIALLEKHAASYSGLSRVLSGRLNKATDPEIAIHRIAREVEKHLDMPNPVASFSFWNRTRRMIALAPYGLLKGIPQVHAPYLDHDLFDFMTTLPIGMLMDRTFHTDAIARAYPAFAHIPYANHKTAAPTDDTHARARFLAEATHRFLLRRPSPLLNNVMPRAKLLAGMLTRGHVHPCISPLVIYLDQIDSMIRDLRKRTSLREVLADDVQDRDSTR